MKPLLCSLLLLLVTSTGMAAQSYTNQLADHPSPYLALHGEDPVAWQDWDPALLERARQDNRLLLLSSGYFTCHWCHVMQQESFRDAEVAGWLNQHFIPVKIDRELQEALDAQLIGFAERNRGRAGWPLNVFVTPDGYPVYASLYLPRDEFLYLITQLQQLWQDDPQGLQRLGRQEAVTGTSLTSHDWRAEEVRELGQRLVSDALQQADPLHGGFGDQQKFPSAPQLAYLLRHYAAQPAAQLGEFLNLTLSQMASQGLRDHVGGGFFRYTTDPDWHTPHFEKMLYDNAQLARLYLHAADILARPEYAEVARDTLTFMQREMLASGGGLVAALSAVDDKNVEGGYYLWQRDTLEQLLTADEYRVVSEYWIGSGSAPFEAGYLPMRRRDDIPVSEQKLLERARDKLRVARQEQRVLPVDDKLLAGWNGLALGAFADAARQLGEAKFRQRASMIRDYLLSSLWDGQQLQRASGQGRSFGQASLADYAYVGQGLWLHYRMTGDRDELAVLRKLLDTAWQRYLGEQGWQLAYTGLNGVGGGEAVIMDGPSASPSAVLLDISSRLAQETGNRQLAQRVQKALNRDSPVMRDSPFWHATQVAVLNRMLIADK